MAKKKSRIQYCRALLEQFSMHYGSNESKLEGWQRLCADCGLDAGPSITQCKKSLKGVHINILDLLHAKQQGVIPQRHASRGKLAAYTLTHDMVFPKHLVKKNGFLKVLLVGVF